MLKKEFTIAKYALHGASGNVKRGAAFTLAEVLITLAIIGIVAAMTFPQLIKNYQGAVLRSQLEKAYSVLTQALQLMAYQEEQIPNCENYNNGKFAPIFIKYFRTVKNCGYNGCEYFANTGNTGVDSSEWLKSKSYLIYSKKKNLISSFFDDGQFITGEGMFIFIENINTLYITVDVNGRDKLPNAWGHDLFTFQVMNNGKLMPMGAAGTNYVGNNYCSSSSDNNLNGIGCTQKALTDINYFKNLP